MRSVMASAIEETSDDIRHGESITTEEYVEQRGEDEGEEQRGPDDDEEEQELRGAEVQRGGLGQGATQKIHLNGHHHMKWGTH
ncbi:unnamed protein product [Arctogadus glacialis]